MQPSEPFGNLMVGYIAGHKYAPKLQGSEFLVLGWGKAEVASAALHPITI